MAARERNYEFSKRDGGYALAKLFDDVSASANSTKSGFRDEYGLPPSWPTLPDSEVQIMNDLRPEYLLGVWVETTEHGEKVRMTLDAFGRTAGLFNALY